MDKEIDVLKFTNDSYNNKKEEQKQQQYVKKLKLYSGIKKTLALLAIAGGVTFAVASPVVKHEVKVICDKIADIDNEKFDEATKTNAADVEQLTGRSVSDIIENSKSK